MKFLQNMANRYRSNALAICFAFFMLFPLVSAASDYSVEFTFIAVDNNGVEQFNEEGKLFVSGSGYRLEVVDELLVVCDGATQWLYKPQTDDIIISQSDIAAEILQSEDELSIIHKLASLFIGSSNGVQDNVKVSKSANGRINEIFVALGGKSYYKIKINSLVEEAEFPNGFFIFDPAAYPDAIITDLR